MKFKKLKDLVLNHLRLNSVFAFAAADTKVLYLMDHPEMIKSVYSPVVEWKALPQMRFAQFAVPKTDLTKEPGQTIQMFTYDNLNAGGELTENVEMSTQPLTGSLKSLTVTEYGNAVSVSQKITVTSFLNIMADVTTGLARDYALTMDALYRDAALATTNIVYAKTSAGAAVTSRAGLTSECTLKVSTIKDALEILATNNAPKANGGANWVCFVHPHQSRDLRDDSHWISASEYGAPEQLFNGEIGRIDDTIFIETTMMSNGAAPVKGYGYKADCVAGATPSGSTTANAVNVFRAVIFGDAYYGIATALPVELRTNGVEDFLRKRSFAWYAILGVGLLHSDYGVVMETA